EPDPPPLPSPAWPVFTRTDGARRELQDAIFAAWHGRDSSDQGGPKPLPEHAVGQDPTSVFLARLVLPATLPATGGRPIRTQEEDTLMKRSIHHLIGDGVVGGVLAGLVVALWFLVVDSLAGRPFHTPVALASALTRQAIGPPTLRLVAAYTVVHFAVFALLGLAMAEAIAVLRTPPRLVFGVLFGLVAQE